MNGMVERAARALCVLEGVDADGHAAERDPPVANWRTFVPVVEAVLKATMLPPIPVLQGATPEAHPALKDWGVYRKTFGLAGAKAREPTLQTLGEWHVTAAWRTWNGMVEAALKDPDEPADH